MAKFVSPRQLGSRRGDAAKRLLAAMTGNPWLVGGSGRFDTRAMAAGGARFIVKMGAEGAHVAIVPGLASELLSKLTTARGATRNW
jgi:L-asparaginase II